MSDPQKYTIGWICALATEHLAAQLFLDEEHEGPESVPVNDSNNYTLGKIGKHHVVIAVLPHGEYGISSAAGVIKDMLHSFPNVRISLMVGIGGGVPSSEHDIRLGDVVVSASSNGTGAVFNYDFGKAVQGQEFRETAFLNQPPTVLRAAVNGLLTRYKRKGHQLNGSITDILVKNPRLKKEFQRPESDTDRLYQPGKVHPPGNQPCATACGNDPSTLVVRSARAEYEDDPAIHYGPIASANRLMKDALTRDALAAKKGVLCFEMEAAGLMNHFPCLVIRGICDYSDSHKNKEWQGFAAMMAAAYAKDLLHQIPPNKVEAEKPIGEVLSSIQGTLDSVLLTTNETRDAMVTVRSDSHRAKVERWLSPPDHSTNAKLARKHRHAGTGTWFLDSLAFKEWKGGSDRHLWLYGPAGCGKTILSTTILDHLLQTETRTTLAFFFDFNDPRKQTLDKLLLSLAFQLYHLEGEVAKRLDNLFASHRNGREQPGVSVLSACIDEMMEMAGNVTVILDALDECETKRDLLTWIQGATSGKTKAQLIMTSRPEAKFQDEIPPLIGKRNCILLDKIAINADIRFYVIAALEQNPDFLNKRLSQNLMIKIRSKVGDGADGMFRWAACQMDSLAECQSPDEVETVLNSLPGDLDETYRRVLEKISPRYKSAAVRLLQFLLYAKRPLTLSEAVEVIATRIDQEPRHFDINCRLFSETGVQQYCLSLVSIAEVRKSDRTMKELHLAHFSVKEYLLKQRPFDLQSASIAITRTCLTYLTDIKGDQNSIKRDFPMARFAAESWMDHAISAEASEDIIPTIGRFLQDKKTFQRWGRLYHADDPWKESPGPPRASALYYACVCGLTLTARHLLAEGADINAQGGKYSHALQAASWRGHVDTVRLLVEKGADLDAQGGEISNAFATATMGPDYKVRWIARVDGLKTTKFGGDHRSALYAASWRGHLDIVRLLVEKGADINAQGGMYGNALQAASQGGHLDIVRLLVEKGAYVNAQGGMYGNALQAASQGGHLDIVRLLVEKGAYVNAQGGKYGNALQAASQGGHRDIVQLLNQMSANRASTKRPRSASLTDQTKRHRP